MNATTILGPIIDDSQTLFSELVGETVGDEGVTRFQYIRYLRMQYHLTKGVQNYFMRVAAHSTLARYRKLRKFLFDFANEEELHYLVAENDLNQLGEGTGSSPIDVLFWHSYFRAIIDERPFVRLGAASILENASGGVVKAALRRALSANFLNRDNTKFIVLHQHETIPHGDQILAALDGEELSGEQLGDLAEGAQTGMLLYYRMARWALDDKELSNLVELPGEVRLGPATLHLEN